MCDNYSIIRTTVAAGRMHERTMYHTMHELTAIYPTRGFNGSTELVNNLT